MSIRFAVATLLFAVTAGAQVSETITVSVTNIDVLVRDGRGNPVRGLTKDDFDIRERGEGREITHFEEITAGDAVPTPRRIMIVIDGNSLPPGPRKHAVEALRKWLPATLRPSDSTMVVTLNPQASVKLPWSSDTAALMDALSAALLDGAGHLSAERRRADIQIANILREANNVQPGPRNVEIPFSDLTNVADAYANTARRHTSATIASLGALLNGFTASGAEKKILVIVGAGLAKHPGLDVYSQLEQIKGEALMGQYPLLIEEERATPFTDGKRVDATRDIEALTRIARRKGVVVYGLNPIRGTGMANMDRGASSAENDFFRDAANMTGYTQLASETSGLAFPGASPEGALEDVTRDLRSYYSIAYKSMGAPDKVQVRTKSGHRVRVLYSAGGYTRDQLVQEAVVAHLIAAPQSNDLGIVVQNDPVVVERGKKRVKLRVFIPVDKLRLLEDAGKLSGSFNVYVASGNARGAASPVNRQTHEIRWTADDLRKHRVIGFSVNVFMHDDADEISVGVLDEMSSLTGFDRTKISG